MNNKLIIISLVIIVAACTKHSYSDDLLLSANNIMSTNPDSALRILEKVPQNILLTDEQHARYALLLTQARNKNYIDETNDSIIKIATSYYTTSGDKYDAMQSLYYLANIQYNMQEYPNSLINYYRAEKIAADIDDKFYLGLIYRGMSAIHTKIYNGVEQSYYAKLSYESFKEYGDSTYIMYALMDYGRTCNNNLECGRSLAIAKKTIAYAMRCNDLILLSESLRLAATSCICLGQPNDAACYYSQLMDMGNKYLFNSDIRNIVSIYYSMGNVATADSILRIHATVIGSIPSEAFASRDEYESAYMALVDEHISQGKMMWQLIGQNATKALTDYIEHEQIVKEVIMKKERLIYVGSISLSLILLMATYITFNLKLKYRKQQEEMLILRAQNLLEDVEQKKEQNSAMKIAMQELLGKRFEDIDKLCTAYYECRGTEREQRKISNEVRQMINNLTNNNELYRDLERFVNKYTDNAVENFRKEFPGLKEKDYRLFLYLATGFTAKAISLFLNEKIEAIYNRKSRLKAKIKNSQTHFKAQFLKLLG